MRVYVEDLRVFADPEGVFSGFLDLLYDDELVETISTSSGASFPFEITFGPLFSGFNVIQRGDAFVPGLINEVGATQSVLTVTPATGPIELFTLRMRAVSPGLASFVADPADLVESQTLLLGLDDELATAQLRLGSTDLIIFSASGAFTSAIDDSYPDGRDDDGNVITSDPVSRNRLAVLNNDNFGQTGNVVEFGLVTSPTLGNVFIDDNGTPGNLNDDFLSYSANVNANGLERFRYVIVTEDGVRSTAEVTISLGSQADDAIVAFDFSLVAADGITPIDPSSIVVGDRIGLQVHAEDLRTSPTFVFNGFLDILYTSGILQPSDTDQTDQFDFDVIFGPEYSTDNGVGTGRRPGIIDELGTDFARFSVPDPEIPDLNPGLLATIFFDAVGIGTVSVVGSPADASPPNDTVLYIETFVPTAQIRFDKLTFSVGPGVVGPAPSGNLVGSAPLNAPLGNSLLATSSDPSVGYQSRDIRFDGFASSVNLNPLDQFIPPGLTANAVLLDEAGNLAYVAAQDAFLVLDVRDPEAIVQLASFATTSATALDVEDGIVFLVAGAGVQVLDVSDPAAIELLDTYTSGNSISSIKKSGTRLYLGESDSFSVNGGLRVLDASDPTTINELGFFPTGAVFDTFIQGGLAYVAEPLQGLRILDVSDPAAISQLSLTDVGEPFTVEVDNSIAYIGTSTGLRIWDVSDPANVALLGESLTSDDVVDVVVDSRDASGVIAYVLQPSGRLDVLNVTSPATPRVLGFFDGLDVPLQLGVGGNVVFVADVVGGVRSLQIEKIEFAIQTILNDDTATLTVSDATVDETEGTVSVTVTLDNAVQGGFTYEFTTFDGTAIAGSDYVTAAGTFSTGSAGLQQTIVIPILADAVPEPDEVFTVRLSNILPLGNVLPSSIDATDVGTVTITEGAGLPRVRVQDVVVNESDGTATVFVWLLDDVGGPFQIGYATLDDSASSPDDYVVTSGTLDFSGSEFESMSFTVEIIDDSTVRVLESHC